MDLCENISTITTNSPVSETWEGYSDELGHYFMCEFASCSVPKFENEFYYDTEVVIIGNGPAAISLSAFLSGVELYYDGIIPHPNQELHERLLNGKNETNLLYEDIDWFAQEFESLIKAGTTPEASFYDTLNHISNNKENYLKVKINKDVYIPHMVIGSGEIGGSWNTYDDQMISLSVSSGMELPGYSIKEFLNSDRNDLRLPAILIREYFQKYVHKMNLAKNFVTNTKVIGIEKLCDISSKTQFWSVTCQKDNLTYTVSCKKVVLAIGKNVVQKLDLKGTYDEDKILYELRDLKSKIRAMQKRETCSTKNFLTSSNNALCLFCTKKINLNLVKVVVIGDGYGAADVVSYCLSMGIQTIHIIKRDKLQMKNHKLSSVSDSMYPEYSSIYRLMMGRIQNPNYIKYLGATVSEIYDDNVVIKTSKGDVCENYTFIVPCIGKKVDNTLQLENFHISNTYRNRHDPTIFGIGSLIGDHYVRECVGGALAVARMILKKTYTTTPESIVTIRDSVQKKIFLFDYANW
uniref:Pyr_redox_2 domain-containing protein n=1 Tax=Parastrongyloides trichosuri TaxID=131310 RepID=A0A0N5A466_PARTI